MNKQKLIKRITYNKYPITTNSYEVGWNDASDKNIEFANKLDEPEKPVVPQFVANWYESHKENFEWSLAHIGLDVMNGVFEDNTEMYDWLNNASNKPFETLVKMKLYGYEVEKEKLYTVKFSNEDFGKIYIGIMRTANKLGFSTLPMNDKYSKCYFTESELKELKFWDNPAFEVKEVEE